MHAHVNKEFLSTTMTDENWRGKKETFEWQGIACKEIYNWVMSNDGKMYKFIMTGMVLA